MQTRLKGIIALLAMAGGAGILATFILMWMPVLAAEDAGEPVAIVAFVSGECWSGWQGGGSAQALGLFERAVTVVSRDTLPARKPHPAPLLHACAPAGTPPAAAPLLLCDLQPGADKFAVRHMQQVRDTPDDVLLVPVDVTIGQTDLP